MRPLVLLSSLQSRGAERVTVSSLARLVERDESVPLCTLTRSHDGDLAAEVTTRGIERLDLAARRLIDPPALLRLIALLRRRRIDLVHAHGQDASILAALACVIEEVPLIVTRHVLEEPRDSWRLASRASLALQALGRADLVVAVSAAVAARLTGSIRMRRPPEVIYNGVEPAFFRVADDRRRRQRSRESLHLGDGPVMLMAAALAPGKGIEVLLAAAEILRRGLPGLTVLLAGEGELEPEVRQAAARLGGTMRWLGHRQDLPDLMAAADLVCQASQAEALPTFLMEAAAAGRAAVATRVGGTEEVVLHGQTGLLIPPGDAAALAAAVQQLISNPARIDGMGLAAARLARRRFSLEAHVEATLAAWQKATVLDRVAA